MLGPISWDLGRQGVMLSAMTVPSRICMTRWARGGDFGVVRHYHDGRPFAAEPLEQIQKARRRRRVEAAGGLICEQDLGFVGQGPRDRDSLPLATRELGRSTNREVDDPPKVQYELHRITSCWCVAPRLLLRHRLVGGRR